MAKINIDVAFENYYSLMLVSGIWPLDNPSILYRMRTLTSWIFTGGLWLTMALEVALDISDLTKLSEILYIMVTIASDLIKLGAFTYNRKKFLKVLDFLRDPIFSSHSEELDRHMENTLRYLNILAKLYQYSTIGCMCFFVIYPIMDNKPYPFPLSFEFGKYRLLVFALQIISAGIAAWNNFCVDLSCITLMGISAAQFEILVEKIENIKSTSDESEIVQKLKHCVDHHLSIIEVVNATEDIYTIGIFGQFATSIAVICNTIFHIILVSTINMQLFMLLTYLLAIMTQIFLYCWYGNEVILKSGDIGNACYTFNWYNCGNVVRRQLFIIMERSKRPSQITPLKLATVSFRTFLAILQWSYSCLALLIKMYEKRKQP